MLTPRECAVLKLRFGLDEEDGEGLTLEVIGQRYDLTRERIRQLQELALGKIRAQLGIQKPRKWA